MSGQTYSFIVIDASDEKHKGLGEHSFRAVPRQGEYVTLQDEEGVGQAYEVVAVVHPLSLARTAGDLYIRRLGTDAELRKALRRT